MNLTELRIGNYVCTSYMKKSVFKVNAIHSDRLYFESVIENFKSDTIPIYVEPIKLTEEWFLKAGFEHKSGNEYVKDRFTYRKSFSDLVINGYEFDYNGIVCYPIYVHQLQNLYFALCGEELVFSSTEP